MHNPRTSHPSLHRHLAGPRRDAQLHRLVAISETALRMAIAGALVWFGVLKVVGVSAVAELVTSATSVLPLISGDAGVPLVGAVEVVLGVWVAAGRPRTLVLAAATAHLLAVSVFAIAARPDLLFQDGQVLHLTVSGQFVVKNVALVFATALLALRSLADLSTKSAAPGSEDRPLAGLRR